MMIKDVAKGNRTCQLCKGVIPKGEACITATGFSLFNSVCLRCCREFGSKNEDVAVKETGVDINKVYIMDKDGNTRPLMQKEVNKNELNEYIH